jgi:hypothetical protein
MVVSNTWQYLMDTSWADVYRERRPRDKATNLEFQLGGVRCELIMENRDLCLNRIIYLTWCTRRSIFVIFLLTRKQTGKKPVECFVFFAWQTRLRVAYWSAHKLCRPINLVKLGNKYKHIFDSVCLRKQSSSSVWPTMATSSVLLNTCSYILFDVRAAIARDAWRRTRGKEYTSETTWFRERFPRVNNPIYIGHDSGTKHTLG